MRKVIEVLLIILMVSAFGAGVAYFSTHEKSEVPIEQETVVEDTDENTFVSVIDVLTYQHQVIAKEQIDSVFKIIPTETLSNVANVLIKKNGYTTIEDIVIEYMTEKDTYDNLLPSSNMSSNIKLLEDSLREEIKTLKKLKKDSV